MIIFDDFTTANQFVDFLFKAKSSAMKILKSKNGNNIKFIYEALQIINYEAMRAWTTLYFCFLWFRNSNSKYIRTKQNRQFYFLDRLKNWHRKSIFAKVRRIDKVYACLVHKPKQPNWNNIAKTDYYIVFCHISIFCVGNLSLRFVFTSDFKSIGFVYNKISGFWKVYFV